MLRQRRSRKSIAEGVSNRKIKEKKKNKNVPKEYIAPIIKTENHDFIGKKCLLAVEFKTSGTRGWSRSMQLAIVTDIAANSQ